MEQMILCTVFPFLHDRLISGTIEVSLQINFRTNEIRFYNSSSHLNQSIEDIRMPKFIDLIGLDYCKITALVLNNGQFILEPVAVRVYLVKDNFQKALEQRLCSPGFMLFETSLADTLRQTNYVVETERKRKSPSIVKLSL